MVDPVLTSKLAVLKRCLSRVREEYRGDPRRLEIAAVEDSIVLNLQRACESAIDLAMHCVAQRKLGLPQNSREGFTLLGTAGLLPADAAERMRRMVGFRNLAVNDYGRLDRAVVLRILAERLDDFEEFAAAIVRIGPG